jgi:hypothetical protein
MALEAYLAGGKLYWTPDNAQQEELIGYSQDISIGVETQTAERLSRDNGPAEVVAQAAIKRDYTLTFTTGNAAAANLARYFYGTPIAKTWQALDVYPLNNQTLSAFDSSEDYEAGDTVINTDGIYAANTSVSAGAFDATQWTRLGGATVTKISANKLNKIAGKAKFVSEPIDGTRKIFVFYRVSLSPSGELSLIGDEYANLTFSGTLQKTEAGVFDIYSEDV